MGYAEYVFKSTQVILACSQVCRINTYINTYLVGPWSSKHQVPKGEETAVLSKSRTLALIYRRGEERTEEDYPWQFHKIIL